MGEWQNIRTEVADKIAVLTVDHPPVNSLNSQVVAELHEAMDELLADDEVKAIVITGGGTNAFIAGADIPEIMSNLTTPTKPRPGRFWGTGRGSPSRLKRPASRS